MNTTSNNHSGRHSKFRLSKWRRAKSATIALSILAAAIAPVHGASIAQTPDNTTPANEGVCDVLQADGTTKGLYGLCVAYCEAHDISDELTPMTEEEANALLASQGPAGKILQAYNRKKSETDPGMPCILIEEPCPCFTDQEIQQIDGFDNNGSQLPLFQCIDADYSSVSPYPQFYLTQVFENSFDGTNPDTSFTNSVGTVLRELSDGSRQDACFLYDVEDGIRRTFQTAGGFTQEQAQSCQNKILDYMDTATCKKFKFPFE